MSPAPATFTVNLAASAAELAEHAQLLADIADPDHELPEAETVRYLVGDIMSFVDQARGEEAFGEIVRIDCLRDALRNLRHVDSHLLEAHVSALAARWPAFDLAHFLTQLQLISGYCFGPGPNTGHLADACLSRLTRALHEPAVSKHWLELVFISLDGAQRTGATATDIAESLQAMLQQSKNVAKASAFDAYEQTDKTARHTDVASREV